MIRWSRDVLVFALLSCSATYAAFPPVEPSIADRPEILLETNYLVYSEAFDFERIELNLTLNNPRVYDEPAKLYLYWQNRETGKTLYFNAADRTFVEQERDMFGATVLTPTLLDFRFFGEGGAFGEVPAEIPRDVGRYQFVFEVRDAAGEKVVARSNAMYNEVDQVVPASGNLEGDVLWSADHVYYLETPLNIVAGATLTIEPGTVVIGSTRGQGTVVVRRDGKLFAEGTADLPIIFTSEFLVGERAPGDWGGLVINGRAPTNQEEPIGEGDSGAYGGDDPNHSSGALRYVRVEFAGIRFSESNELNGIALQGVGRGTVIDHVQVHFNQDDGIEFFGGTVDAKYVLITDARDDSLDWTFGWQGRLQHFVAIQRHEQADKGMEADNFDNNPSARPISDPRIFNATFIGNGPIAADDASTDTGSGMLLRRGTYAEIGQAIVTGFWEPGLEIDGAESRAVFGDLLTVGGSFFYGNELGDGFNLAPEVEAVLARPDLGNSSADPRLPNPGSIVQPDIAPLRGSPARSVGARQPDDGFFDLVPWAGGVDPDDSWINEGWTTFSDN